MELKNLRKLRKEKNLTQAQASVIFNVSLTAYNNWEMGDFEPSLKTLVQMADFFGTSIDYIVGREQKDFSPEEKKILQMAADIIKEKVK